MIHFCTDARSARLSLFRASIPVFGRSPGGARVREAARRRYAHAVSIFYTSAREQDKVGGPGDGAPWLEAGGVRAEAAVALERLGTRAAAAELVAQLGVVVHLPAAELLLALERHRLGEAPAELGDALARALHKRAEAGHVGGVAVANGCEEGRHDAAACVLLLVQRLQPCDAGRQVVRDEVLQVGRVALVHGERAAGPLAGRRRARGQIGEHPRRPLGEAL